MSVCCCSVAKSCPTVSDPVGCSTPGSPVLYHLPEFAQIHVHWLSDDNLTISSSAALCFCLWSFPASGSFPMSWLFASGGQNIGVSASASVLPMTIQDWFPLGLTYFILQSKVLSRVFSKPQFKSINFWTLSLLYGPPLTSIHDYWKNNNFLTVDLRQQSNVSTF